MKGVIYTTTKELLLNTPLPLETKSYKPVEHRQLIDLTLEGIALAGFNIEKERYTSAKDGNVANGRFSINTVSDNEMNLQIMWQNSYDKSLKLEFSIGAEVLVCGNGMVAFRTMDSFRKKHVGDIQTLAPSRIAEYIKNAGDIFQGLQGERDRMKNIEVTRREAAEYLGRLYIDNGILEATQLNIIKRELDKPTFDYKAAGSLWELYNYTTFAIGGIHPQHWMEDHMAAHKFFSEIAALAPGNVQAAADLIEEAIVMPADAEEDPRIKQLKLWEQNDLDSGNVQNL